MSAHVRRNQATPGGCGRGWRTRGARADMLLSMAKPQIFGRHRDERSRKVLVDGVPVLDMQNSEAA